VRGDEAIAVSVDCAADALNEHVAQCCCSGLIVHFALRTAAYSNKFGGFEIDQKLEFRCTFDRKQIGLRALEYLLHVESSAPTHRNLVRSIRHQANCQEGWAGAYFFRGGRRGFHTAKWIPLG
jgi:hypothetical protein